MALPDVDLGRRLRDLRVRGHDLAPPPSDLAQAVRARHRRQRRTGLWRLAAAGVAVALLVLGVPVLASSLDAQLPETADPSAETPRWTGRVLYEQPTRGSLAGDEDWLAGIAARELVPGDPAAAPSPGRLPDPAVQQRAVAFAGDVPGERVALVVARLWGGRVIQAWFTGPRGAEPDEMTMTLLRDAPSTGPLSLLDLPDPASDRYVLVVVAFPGDEVELMTGRTVTAAGETLGRWEPVPTEDGVGTLSLDVPVIWLQDNAQVRIARDGEYTAAFAPRLSERAAAVEERSSVDLAALPDPRGVEGAVPESVVWEAVHHLVGRFGSHPHEMGLTLLSGGPVPGLATSTLLVGATLPSGATVGFLAAYPNDLADPVAARTSVTMTATAPAGTALLDRVFAMALSDAFVVCGPAAGTQAELLDPAGTPIGTVPLVGGAGAVPVPAQRPVTVRILDASGALVTAAEVTLPGE
jgi:hypothetical protein